MFDRIRLAVRRTRALDAEETARILDCRPRDLPELAEDGLLVPIDGDPPKYAKDDVERCRLELERHHKALDEFRRLGEELFGEE